MSAQAQMRAMLDQLMGTSRDGKSQPEPRGWGRGRGRGRGRPQDGGFGGAPGPARGTEEGAPRLVTRGPRLPSRPIRTLQAGSGGGSCADWRELLPMGLRRGLKAERRVCTAAVDLAGVAEPTSCLALVGRPAQSPVRFLQTTPSSSLLLDFGLWDRPLAAVLRGPGPSFSTPFD